MVINGVVGGMTGIAAIPVIRFNGQIVPQSSVNGCVIASFATCNVPVSFDNPIQDVIGALNGNQPGVITGVEQSSIQSIADGFFNAPLMEINQIAPAGFAPLIDEPVTGTGNDDLTDTGEELRKKLKPVVPGTRSRPRGGGSTPGG